MKKKCFLLELNKFFLIKNFVTQEKDFRMKQGGNKNKSSGKNVRT